MISNIQALAREVEVYLNSDTQVASILRLRTQAGTPNTIHRNFMHNSLRNIAAHGIYLKNTDQPRTNAILNSLLATDKYTPTQQQ